MCDGLKAELGIADLGAKFSSGLGRQVGLDEPPEKLRKALMVTILSRTLHSKQKRAHSEASVYTSVQSVYIILLSVYVYADKIYHATEENCSMV